MPWFRVDDGFSVHPKTLRCSLAAVGLWVKAGAWSAHQLTDGLVPNHVVRSLGGTPKLARELVEAGLWLAVDGSFQFHDWTDFNPTREEVKKRRKVDVMRKKTPLSDGVDNSERNPNGNLRSPSGGISEPRARARAPVPSRPVPSRPVPAREEGSGGLALVSPPGPRQRAAKGSEALTTNQVAWEAYRSEFLAVHEVEPLRDAQTNKGIANFTKRVPAAWVAPTVRAYVRSTNPYYVTRKHPVDLLARDAPQLFALAQGSREVTSFEAREADKRKGRGNQYAEAFARLGESDEEAAQ